MKIRLRLFLTFQKFSPTNENIFSLKIPNNMNTIEYVLTYLKIPDLLPKIILINGQQANYKTTLSEDDLLIIFPPLEGG